jgi:hypothetical protein
VTTFRQVFVIVAMMAGWFALVAQFFLAIDNRTAPAGETAIRYISYFTIEANGLATLGFTVLLVARRTVPGRWFSRQSVVTAITTYMVVVGLTYNIILRSLWKPSGLQWVVDELLHSVLPVGCVFYWLLYASAKKRLPWKAVPSWMLYPLAYCIYTMIRGGMTGWYPYPFLDAGVLGYPRVLLYIGGMIVVFFGVAALFVVVAKRIYQNGG